MPGVPRRVARGRWRESVEARAPVVVARTPGGGDEALLLQTIQGGIERALADAESVAGALLEAFGDAPPVHGSELQGFEDEHVEHPAAARRTFFGRYGSPFEVRKSMAAFLSKFKGKRCRSGGWYLFSSVRGVELWAPSSTASLVYHHNQFPHAPILFHEPMRGDDLVNRKAPLDVRVVTSARNAVNDLLEGRGASAEVVPLP